MNICICCFCFNQTCILCVSIVYINLNLCQLTSTFVKAHPHKRWLLQLQASHKQSLIIRSRAYPWRWWAQDGQSIWALMKLVITVHFVPSCCVCGNLRTRWWAQMDSNHRPRAYQARALTTWAMSPFSSFASLSLWSRLVILSYDWWRWWDSNPWPPACRAGALPTELHPHRCVSRFSLLVFAFSFKACLELLISG